VGKKEQVAKQVAEEERRSRERKELQERKRAAEEEEQRARVEEHARRKGDVKRLTQEYVEKRRPQPRAYTGGESKK
jgi:hypothetical protein